MQFQLKCTRCFTLYFSPSNGALFNTSRWEFRSPEDGHDFCSTSTYTVLASASKLIEKLYILTPLQKLLKNEGDLDKLIVAKDFKKLPKVQ